MYTSFYNLDNKPFEVSPDPSFLWLGEKQKNDYSTLGYGVVENKGFLLLSGEAGCGKTVMTKALTQSLGEDVQWTVIDDPSLERIDFYNAIAGGFGIEKKFTSKVQFLIQFSHFLHKADDENQKVLLLVDDCHLLSQEMLEELRLLSNIEKADAKLINIVFIGRPEFNDLLVDPKNRALNQRMTLVVDQQPLNAAETDDYIRHRLRIAGTEEKIFTAKAVKDIHRYSQGIPGRINAICDHALGIGFVLARKTIDNKIVESAVQEMELPLYPHQDDFDPFLEDKIDFNPFKGKILPGTPPIPAPLSGFNLEDDHQKNWLQYSLGLLVLCMIGGYFLFQKPQSLESSQPTAEVVAEVPVVKPVVKVSTSPAVTVLAENKIEMSEEKAAELRTAILEKAYDDGEQEQKADNILPGGMLAKVNTAIAGEIKSIDPMVFEKAEEVENVSRQTVSGQPKESQDLHIQADKSTIESSLENRADAAADEVAIAFVQGAPSISEPEVEEKLKEQSLIPAVPLEPRKVSLALRPNSLELTTAGRKSLGKFVEKLKLYPRATVFVKGYVSAKTNSPENIKLSEDRAQIVQKMMMEKGIDAEQIEVVGMGNQEPIASNDTREGRRKNRRVEVIVINDGI